MQVRRYDVGRELKSKVRRESHKQEAKTDAEREEHIWTKHHKIKKNTRKNDKVSYSSYPDGASLFSNHSRHLKCVHLRWHCH